MSSDLFAGLSLNPTVSPGKVIVNGDQEVAPTTPVTKKVHANGSLTEESTPTVAPPPSATPPEQLTSAPATDKLLGLLVASPASAPAPVSPSRTGNEAATTATTRNAGPPASPGSRSTAETTAADSAPAVAPSPSSAPPPARPRDSEALATEEVLTAFSMEASPKIKPSLRGVGKVVTPIPNPDVATRLFQKFASKTQSSIPETHGGTQKLTFLGFLFGSSATTDRHFDAYKSLMERLDSPSDAVARFCHLVGVWGHASAHMAEVESKTSSSYQTFCRLLASALDAATALVSHGCLDGVIIKVGDDSKSAVHCLAESVFCSDLSQERIELAAMKFLLTTGCRPQQAMLRKSHLLQSIRVLYHVYLTTESNANKTTARASLQQLVTSVFVRMIESPVEDEDSAEFPSENHRDAFLVLRSLCKLSVRNPPTNMHSHVGLQAGNSNTTWDAEKLVPDHTPGATSDAGHKTETPSLIYTQAIHPALESKILALDLLLYVLQNTDMKGDSFLHHVGSQFHYAIRNYLCVSLLKNCTSDNTGVVSLSLRVFVPLIRNFRPILKAEIEAFVTNVFFVILDSKNSPMDHKLLVVTLFEEICSDPQTLAEIFLNYDCDLSAVDLFHRLVQTLAKVARSMEIAERESTISLVAGSGAARMEKLRGAHRELRLEAMRALRQVLASLHGSIVKPMEIVHDQQHQQQQPPLETNLGEPQQTPESELVETKQQNLVEIYGSKKKRREEESEVILRFNQKPSAGLAYASQCGHVNGSDPDDVARYLLANKDKFDKTQIGDFLGRETDYQNGFAVKVLHGYVNSMDFEGLVFDDAIRYYLSGFRLPGEAQKIDRIMEKFAERFTAQNPSVFPSADVAFILAFSIIMLNTDLHNPAIKEERRMTKEGFIRNNRGICDGQDLPPEFLMDIFDRIKSNPISLKEDEEARERFGDASVSTSLPSAISPAAFFASPYQAADRTKETNFNKERDQIVRTTESLLRRRRLTGTPESAKATRRTRSNSQVGKHHTVKYVRTEDSGLRDEYVSPMFEVTWGPALAAFSTAMESANGTVGALLSIATDDELEAAAMNAAETIEVCLTGFRFAICTAGLCGNDVARDAYLLALTRFSQLGSGILLEPRHIRCIQTLLELARSDGELLGSSWEHVFKALSEINRFHQLFQLLARNDKAIAAAAERRRARLHERERRRREKERRKAAKQNSESMDDSSTFAGSDGDFSYTDSELFSDSSDFEFRDDMSKKEIDEVNARTVYEAVSEGVIEAIYERSSSLSTAAVKEFVLQLCRVSRMEISNYGGQVGSDSNQVTLTQVHYRQHHSLLGDAEGFHHHQPNIYNLQKLVEVTHYNMESRPRMVFADLWTLVSAHLTSTALHSNAAVAMYAVDSFRQLSIQYLQREELGVFEFQRRFLKPLETVMARSEVHTTKELLLKCVERLILMFGSSADDGNRRGMLRSGWRPVLTVLGLAGRDHDKEIAELGFSMLTAQLEPILNRDNGGNKKEKAKTHAGVLLDERFVDLVDALLIYVEGPHEEMSLKCIDHLLTLSSFLADESFALPLIKKRGGPKGSMSDDTNGEPKEDSGNQELELWWPLLLGISKAIGDERKQVRVKSLDTLSRIITSHFFPTAESVKDELKREKQVQLLQLIFRGILTPVLEFAELEVVSSSKPPQLPDDFDRFLTGTKAIEAKPAGLKTPSFWLDTTFDHFMDTCVNICLKSGEAFGEDILLEEIFAMLNSCLLSDSGSLAVRGLRRLEQLLTGDLKVSRLTDETWATVSHMLRRCLKVRSLPKTISSVSGNGIAVAISDEQKADDNGINPELEQKEAIREFVMEDNMLVDRRFIGSNAVMVIGVLLGAERFAKSLGLRWRLFLVTGLGKAIPHWEYAAKLIAENNSKVKPKNSNPPSYLETAIYGRKYMNRFLLQIASMKDVADVVTEGSKQATGQMLVKEQTQNLVTAFLEKEAVVAKESKPLPSDVKVFERLTSLVKDMLAGYSNLPDEHVAMMSWLNPVLSSCIHTENESIRLAIQKLVTRLHK